jgi:hypothetical protein
MTAKQEKLDAEVVELRKDKARLDWLDWVNSRSDQASIESITAKFVQRDGYYPTWTIRRYFSREITREHIRAAIDAAMEGKV